MAFPFALHRGAEFFVDRDRLIQLRAHAAYRGLLFKDRLAPTGPRPVCGPQQGQQGGTSSRFDPERYQETEHQRPPCTFSHAAPKM